MSCNLADSSLPSRAVAVLRGRRHRGSGTDALHRRLPQSPAPSLGSLDPHESAPLRQTAPRSVQSCDRRSFGRSRQVAPIRLPQSSGSRVRRTRRRVSHVTRYRHLDVLLVTATTSRQLGRQQRLLLYHHHKGLHFCPSQDVVSCAIIACNTLHNCRHSNVLESLQY